MDLLLERPHPPRLHWRSCMGHDLLFFRVDHLLLGHGHFLESSQYTDYRYEK